MPRRLDILIPHWQETAEEMEPMLDSIALQRNIDLSEVGVIIAFDGPDATNLPIEFWADEYPFAIEEVHPEKGGVSHTRNAALDASKADFVQFADADDLFCDICGLSIVFREMDSTPNPQELAMSGLTAAQVGNGFDVLVSCFREETKDPEGNIVYINRDNDSTFVHGKCYRRQYLIDNDLRFNPNLTIHEDSFFNILARECAAPMRAKYCPMPFYLWAWRDQSVCRHDPKYILKTFNNMIASNDALLDEFTRRMMPEKANAYCVMMCWDAYFTMCKREWRDQENQEYRMATERRFAECFRKHHAKWEAVPETDKLMISQGIRQRSIQEGMLMESVTIDQWLSNIQEAYPAA